MIMRYLRDSVAPLDERFAKNMKRIFARNVLVNNDYICKKATKNRKKLARPNGILCGNNYSHRQLSNAHANLLVLSSS